MPKTTVSSRAWWQDAVFYQIYPLSFVDSNGDGYGDLEGIRSRLDYLSETLGVDAIWLSPFFRSPMKDWGYDVSDHTDVDPLFGDLVAAERLIDEVHARGMRIIVDYVMNHTSDRHPWFQESRSSLTHPKRQWYVWRDPKPDGSPPNNWVSSFGGPAWTLDSTTGQYYRHSFLSSQPDLNWRNTDLREAMYDVARFWLDRGADGFRVDAADQVMKDPSERDNPLAPPDYQRPWKAMGEYDDFIHLYDHGHPDVHLVHREFRRVVDAYQPDLVTVGEIHIFDTQEWASYYGPDLDELHMPFNFLLMATPWDAAKLRTTVENVLCHVPDGGWTNWVLGNHDERRLTSRIGEENARLAALLLLTLRGTPFLYYGDELAMLEASVPVEKRRDPWGQSVEDLSRDGVRTPMQWSSAPGGGFCPSHVEPWLPCGPEQAKRNVDAQLVEPGSMLDLYRRLLRLRRASAALKAGSYISNPASGSAVFGYRRQREGETMSVALNLSDSPQSIDTDSGQVVVSTLDPDRGDAVNGSVKLAAREGVLIRGR